MLSKSLTKAINFANITCNESEVEEIISTMSEEDINHTGKMGIKHWKVLRKIVINNMEKDLNLDEAQVVNRYFIWGPCAYGNINTLSSGGVFYYRIIITKTHFIAYGYDQCFRLIEKHNKEIQNLESIKQGKAGSMGFIPRDGAIFKFLDGTKVIILATDKFARHDAGLIIKDLSTLNPGLTQVNIFLDEE